MASKGRAFGWHFGFRAERDAQVDDTPREMRAPPNPIASRSRGGAVGDSGVFKIEVEQP
jgi:hypothetical protein